jgi:hypothetical protein
MSLEDRTEKAAQSGKDSQKRAAGKGQPEKDNQDCQDRPLVQNCQERTFRT